MTTEHDWRPIPFDCPECGAQMEAFTDLEDGLCRDEDGNAWLQDQE